MIVPSICLAILVGSSACASSRIGGESAASAVAPAPAGSLLMPRHFELPPGQQPCLLAVGPIGISEEAQTSSEEGSSGYPEEMRAEREAECKTVQPSEDLSEAAFACYGPEMQTLVAATLDSDQAFDALIVEDEPRAVLDAGTDSIHYLMGVRFYIYGNAVLDRERKMFAVSLYLIDIVKGQLIGTLFRRADTLHEASQSAAAGILEHVKNDIRIREAMTAGQ